MDDDSSDDLFGDSGTGFDADAYAQDGPDLFGTEPDELILPTEPVPTPDPDMDLPLDEMAEIPIDPDEEPADDDAPDAARSVPAAGAQPTPRIAPDSVVPEAPHSTATRQDEADAAASDPARERPAAPLALYRRYRPDTFADVIGQEHVTEPLQRALVNNRVNHAYLFSGPRGCGKTSSARILARCLNCEQGPTPSPCGECRSCRDLARGGPGSIDVIEMDAATHGLVEDARSLRERAFFSPVHSRYKIYIIDEAHMVTPQGFNALLKVVEEPPAHVKFIFATTEPEKVLGTIRSRTHHYPFRLVPPKTLAGYLARLCEAEGVAVDPAVLPLVVRAGAGSVRDSLSVLDQLLGAAGDAGVSYRQATGLLGYTPDTLLDEIVDAFAADDAEGVFACIDKVIEVGQDPRRFAEDLLRRLRDLIIVAAVPDALATGLVDVAGDQGERLTVQANGLGPGELTRAAEVIANGLTEMRGTTAPRLHLELMCARVLLPGADVDGRGVHARLDRLERRLNMAGGDESAGAGQTRPGSARTPSRPAAAAAPPEGVPDADPHPGSRRRGEAEQGGATLGQAASAATGRGASRQPGGDGAAGAPVEPGAAGSGGSHGNEPEGSRRSTRRDAAAPVPEGAPAAAGSASGFGGRAAAAPNARQRSAPERATPARDTASAEYDVPEPPAWLDEPPSEASDPYRSGPIRGRQAQAPLADGAVAEGSSPATRGGAASAAAQRSASPAEAEPWPARSEGGARPHAPETDGRAVPSVAGEERPQDPGGHADANPSTLPQVAGGRADAGASPDQVAAPRVPAGQADVDGLASRRGGDRREASGVAAERIPPASGEPAGRADGAASEPGRSRAAGAHDPSRFGTADLRNVWPQVLDAVKGRRRVTWIGLQQNTQVHELADGVLTLAVNNPGALDMLTRGGSDDIIRESVLQVVGIAPTIRVIPANSDLPPRELWTGGRARGAADAAGRGPGGGPGESSGPERSAPAARAGGGDSAMVDPWAPTSSGGPSEGGGDPGARADSGRPHEPATPAVGDPEGRPGRGRSGERVPESGASEVAGWADAHEPPADLRRQADSAAGSSVSRSAAISAADRRRPNDPASANAAATLDGPTEGRRADPGTMRPADPGTTRGAGPGMAGRPDPGMMRPDDPAATRAGDPGATASAPGRAARANIRPTQIGNLSDEPEVEPDRDDLDVPDETTDANELLTKVLGAHLIAEEEIRP